MRVRLKYVPMLIMLALLTACGSDDEDCMKTITIPQTYFVGNQSYTNEITQEVPCDFPDAAELQVIEPPILENFSYEVSDFEFIPDTGNNTRRIMFEILLNNPNNFDAIGIPLITIRADDIESSTTFSNLISNPCPQIDANSNCTLILDIEESLDFGIVESFEIINVRYILTE